MKKVKVRFTNGFESIMNQDIAAILAKKKAVVIVDETKAAPLFDQAPVVDRKPRATRKETEE